jgi:hypothetical protein
MKRVSAYRKEGTEYLRIIYINTKPQNSKLPLLRQVRSSKIAKFENIYTSDNYLVTFGPSHKLPVEPLAPRDGNDHQPHINSIGNIHACVSIT